MLQLIQHKDVWDQIRWGLLISELIEVRDKIKIMK
jgi:hypothetical protein